MFWIAYLIFFPGIFVILGAPDGLGHHTFFWIGGAWFVSVVVADSYLSAFRCPRCMKRYFLKPWFNNPYARKCLHCGLRRWSGDGETSN
jgi:hypothetical protein